MKNINKIILITLNCFFFLTNTMDLHNSNSEQVELANSQPETHIEMPSHTHSLINFEQLKQFINTRTSDEMIDLFTLAIPSSINQNTLSQFSAWLSKQIEVPTALKKQRRKTMVWCAVDIIIAACLVKLTIDNTNLLPVYGILTLGMLISAKVRFRKIQDFQKRIKNYPKYVCILTRLQ